MSSAGVSAAARKGPGRDRPVEPCGLVVFGASGSLARDRLGPALGELRRRRLLPEGFFVLGFGRASLEASRIPGLAPGLENVHYLQGDYAARASYEALKLQLQILANRYDTRGNLLFYLAVPAFLYPTILMLLDQTGLLEKDWGGWSRVIVEKPFGRDADAAAALDAQLRCHVEESQLFRMDHVLGRETLRDVLTLRTANALFEPVWNRDRIDHVQISVLETAGIADRGAYYGSAGVLRDMFQETMFQLLAMIAMEPPPSLAPEAIRDEIVKLFRSLKPWDDAADGHGAVLGQYSGCRDEAGSADASVTPTYAAIRLEIDNWRWRGIPFYLRSGKCLKQAAIEVSVAFKPAFPAGVGSDSLILKLAPIPGLGLTLPARQPGAPDGAGALDLDLDWASIFSSPPLPAYPDRLHDCLLGDLTTFQRRDALDETWRWLAPLLNSGRTPCT
ncbi:MAG: glucose-6-phosphate dehydrogenase, partial [Elusimicrobiota bacterium]